MSKIVWTIFGLFLICNEPVFPTSCAWSYIVIKGSIIDHREQPVEGVLVASFYYEEEYESKGGSRTHQCLSDKNGNFKCNSYFGTATFENGRVLSCAGKYPSNLELIFVKDGYLLSKRILPLTKDNKKGSTVDFGSVILVPIHEAECIE